MAPSGQAPHQRLSSRCNESAFCQWPARRGLGSTWGTAPRHPPPAAGIYHGLSSDTWLLHCCSHVGLVLVIPLACGEVGTGSQTGPSDCPQLTRTYLLGVNLESANTLYIHLCRHYPFRNVLTDRCIVRTAAGMLEIVRSYYDMTGRLLCRPPPPPALCCTQSCSHPAADQEFPINILLQLLHTNSWVI